MRSVYDRTGPLLSFSLQEVHEVATGEQVEVYCDLVQQEDNPGPGMVSKALGGTREHPAVLPYEAHGQLDPSALSVADGMHPPCSVDIQDVDQLIASLRIKVPSDRSQQSRYIDVSAYDWVEYPLDAQVSHAFKALLKGVHPPYVNGAAWG